MPAGPFQSFLTGVKQNFARKLNASVESVKFKFEFLEADGASVEPFQPLDLAGDGNADQGQVVIYGINIEGQSKFNAQAPQTRDGYHWTPFDLLVHVHVDHNYSLL